MVTAKKLEEDVLTYLHNNFILINKAMSDFRNGTLSDRNTSANDSAANYKFTYHDTYYIGLEYFVFLSFIIKRSITLSDIFSSEFKTSADKLMAQKTQELIDSVDAYYHMNKISLSELQDKRFPVYSRIFDCGYAPVSFLNSEIPAGIPMKQHFFHAICAVSTLSLNEIATDKFVSSEVLEQPVSADVSKSACYHALFMRLENISYTFYEVMEDSKSNYLKNLRSAANTPVPQNSYVSQPAKPVPEHRHKNKIAAPIIGVACVCMTVLITSQINHTAPSASNSIPREVLETADFRHAIPEIPVDNPLTESTIPAHMTFYSRGDDIQYGTNYDYNHAPFRINLPKGTTGCYYIKITPLEPGTTWKGEPYIFFAKTGHGPIEMNICNGTYEVSYATGSTWYGPEDLFGPAGQYYKCDQTLHFYYENNQVHGQELTLYEVLNGNLPVDRVAYKDF